MLVRQPIYARQLLDVRESQRKEAGLDAEIKRKKRTGISIDRMSQ
jgi:hypothetical protein